MEQWQYEVTSGGHLWYGIDDRRRTVWLTEAMRGIRSSASRLRHAQTSICPGFGADIVECVADRSQTPVSYHGCDILGHRKSTPKAIWTQR
jgi:hypothetical protein